MKNNQKFIIAALTLVMLTVYFFVTAPPPLEKKKNTGTQLPIDIILNIANEENKIIRKLYTKDILQAGKKVGIKFDEEWQEKSVIAGMLPAQFLRETALYLEKSSVRLSLYLGSDYPINEANIIEGIQSIHFKKLKETQQDIFFNIPEEQLYIYMSPDKAISKACVTCHNEHAESPKTNWKINDIMGATTWLYPKKSISLNEALILLAELRNGFKASYQYFLNEVKQMPNTYAIGKKWPKQGRYVPSSDVFMQEFNRRSAPITLNKLMSFLTNNKQG